jgi:hypothetical protein
MMCAARPVETYNRNQRIGFPSFGNQNTAALETFQQATYVLPFL